MNKTPTRFNESRVEHEGLERSATLKRSYVSRPGRLIEVKEVEEAPEITEALEIEGAARTEDVVGASAPVDEVPVESEGSAEESEVVAESEVVEESEKVEESTEEVLEVAQEPEVSAKIVHFAPMVEQSGIPAEEPKESPRDAKRIIESHKVVEDDAESDKPVEKHPIQKAVAKKVVKKPVNRAYPSAKEIKDAAIEKALREVQEEQDETFAKMMSKERRRKSRNKFIIAFAASAACIGVLGYFVSLRVPDISLKVAALQTGINAAYPSYVPRDYKLSGVSAENDGRIVMSFKGPGGYSFTLTEEKSSWDSQALLNNYVKKNWNADYDVIRESGLTIYVSHSDAVWLNAGKMFVIDASANNLTKKQIKNIAISL